MRRRVNHVLVTCTLATFGEGCTTTSQVFNINYFIKLFFYPIQNRDKTCCNCITQYYHVQYTLLYKAYQIFATRTFNFTYNIKLLSCPCIEIEISKFSC